MKHRIKEIWRNIGLTGKLNLIILLSICFVSLAGLAAIRYLTVCYNEELYEKNAMALKYITSDLETELKAISTMTDYMVADEAVQNNLTVLKDSPDPAKRTRAVSYTHLALPYSPWPFRSPLIRQSQPHRCDGSQPAPPHAYRRQGAQSIQPCLLYTSRCV